MKFILFALFTCLYGISIASTIPAERDTSSDAVWSWVKAQDTSDVDLRNSPGFLRLADDGVLRKYDRNWKVVSYKQLSPDEITNMLRIGNYDDQQKKHLAEVFDGVDGRSVTDENVLLHPSEDLMPVAARESPKQIGQRDVDSRQSPSANIEVLRKLRRGEEQGDCSVWSCTRPEDCMEYDYRCRSCWLPDSLRVGLCMGFF